MPDLAGTFGQVRTNLANNFSPQVAAGNLQGNLNPDTAAGNLQGNLDPSNAAANLKHDHHPRCRQQRPKRPRNTP